MSDSTRHYSDELHERFGSMRPAPMTDPSPRVDERRCQGCEDAPLGQHTGPHDWETNEEPDDRTMYGPPIDEGLVRRTTEDSEEQRLWDLAHGTNAAPTTEERCPTCGRVEDVNHTEFEDLGWMRRSGFPGDNGWVACDRPTTEERCPTCGSTDREERGPAGVPTRYRCLDSWHATEDRMEEPWDSRPTASSQVSQPDTKSGSTSPPGSEASSAESAAATSPIPTPTTSGTQPSSAASASPEPTTEDSTFREDARLVQVVVERCANGWFDLRQDQYESAVNAWQRILTSYESMRTERDSLLTTNRIWAAQYESLKHDRDYWHKLNSIANGERNALSAQLGSMKREVNRLRTALERSEAFDMEDARGRIAELESYEEALREAKDRVARRAGNPAR